MSRRHRTPYDEDELDITRPSYRPPTQAGPISAVSALISLGLLGTIGVLWLLAAHRASQDETALILVGIIFLDLGAFAASVIGLVQGVRSQAREQIDHRGYGLTGLICSIIALLAAIAIGVVATCAGLFVAAVQNIPGG